MLFAGEFPCLVGHRLQVLPAVGGAVVGARGDMLAAGLRAATDAREDLVGGRDRRGLVRAGGLVLPAGEPPRAVGPPQVRRAMHSPIDSAYRLMRAADVAIAARASNDFIDPHRLVLAALA